MMRFIIMVLSVTLASLSSFADDMSDGILVYLKPEMSSFWHTATNRTIDLPVDFPASATKATLTITGAFGYTQTVSDIITHSVTVTLPVADHSIDKPATEDVFDFSLSFNDGTVRTARLGLISGLGAEGEGATRCIAPATDRKWAKVNGSVAIPIPYGMKTFEIGGVSTNTGLNGAQGWFPLKLRGRTEATLTGLVGEELYSSTLSGVATGLSVIIR